MASRALLIFLGALLSYSLMLGNTVFFSRGEAREALVTAAMVEQHDLVMPLTKAEEISCKPPALHWLGVLTSKISGAVTPQTIRFPSVFLASLTLALLFLLLTQVSSTQSALLTVMILGTSFEWLRGASHARVDMCLAVGLVFCLIALFQIIHRWDDGIRKYWPWLLVALFSATFATLSKGPMGLFIPVAIAGIYFLLISPNPKLKKATSFLVFPALPLLIASLLLASVWYIYSYYEQGELFVRVHLINENLARFIDVPDFHPGHRKPFYYGFIYLFSTFVPWTFFLPLTGVWLWKSRSKLLSMQTNGILFAIVWVTVIFLMGTISSSKRSVYFLPALPPLAYLVAYSLIQVRERLVEQKRSYFFLLWSLRILAGLFGAALILVAAIVFLAPAHEILTGLLRKPKDIALVSLIRDILSQAPEFYCLALVALGFAICAARFVRQERIVQAAYALTLSMLIGGLSVSFSVLPKTAQSLSPLHFASRIEAVLQPNDHIFQYKHTDYALTYYLKRPMPHVSNVLELPNKSYLLVRTRDKDEALRDLPEANLVLQNTLGTSNVPGKMLLYQIVNSESTSS